MLSLKLFNSILIIWGEKSNGRVKILVNLIRKEKGEDTKTPDKQ